MLSGDLRRRMTLQNETLVSDGSGGQSTSWQTLGDLWADIKPLTSPAMRHLVGAPQGPTGADRRLTHQITVRYRTDILNGMRLMYGSRLFTIRAVVNRGEENRWLELMVEEGGLL